MFSFLNSGQAATTVDVKVDKENVTIGYLLEQIKLYDNDKGLGRKAASALSGLGFFTGQTEFISELKAFLNIKRPDVSTQTGSFTRRETQALLDFLASWQERIVKEQGTLSLTIHQNLYRVASLTNSGRAYLERFETQTRQAQLEGDADDIFDNGDTHELRIHGDGSSLHIDTDTGGVTADGDRKSPTCRI